MTELIKLISTYHILNYLLTGAIFLFFWRHMLPIPMLIDKNIVENIFIYYFFGMLLSRIGSLIIEKIALESHFIKYAKYEDFIEAEKKDAKIGLLLEMNNLYRTNIAVFLSLFILETPFILGSCGNLQNRPPNDLFFYVLSFILSILFIFSYKKQTSYIVKRVAMAKSLS